MKKLIQYFLAPLILLSTSSFANVFVAGGGTEISDYIASSYKTETEAMIYDNSFSSNDILYVNAALIGDSDIDKIESMVLNRATTVLDLRGLPTDEEKSEFSLKISGMGVVSPLLILGFLDGEMIANSIVDDVTYSNGNSIKKEPTANLESLKKSTVFAINRIRNGGVK
ncbi:hypothetical protein ACT31I_002132 [Vibrio cidicii]|nr:hypothetical protein [Vibrio cidicii]